MAITIDEPGGRGDNALHGARQALARRRSRRPALHGPLLLAMQRLVNAVMSGYMLGHRLVATILWLVTLRREKLGAGTWTFLGVVANI